MKYRNLVKILFLLIISSCIKNSKTSAELIDNDILVENFTSVDTTYFSNKSIKTLKYIKSESEYVNVNLYESGKKKSIGTVKNGHVHGEYIDWHENGNIQWIRYYDSGNQIGEYRTYSPNGVITVFMNNDTNEYIEYYSNGQPKLKTVGAVELETPSEDLYANDFIVQNYYTNGKIKRKYTIKSKNEYLDEYYNENGELGFKGKIISDTTYQNGSLFTGKILTYFLNGNISHSTEVKNGLLMGKSVNYYGNGNMEYVMNFENNEARDSIIFYHENGKMKSKENIKTGEIKQWDESGIIIK